MDACPSCHRYGREFRDGSPVHLVLAHQDAAVNIFAVAAPLTANTLRLRGSWSKHCWFRPVCASSPVVLLVRSLSLAGWVMIQDSAWEVGYWSGGAPVGKKSPNEVVAPQGRAGSPGLGPSVTPFAGVPPGEPVGFDAGEGNPGSVIILQKWLGVSTVAVVSSVCRG
ncbi:hypothetical protein BHM03_00058057 [Ensete ventricosum]|nr:hypothetical protein BHM03_00058057 [Ensete ventricosum]